MERARIATERAHNPPPNLLRNTQLHHAGVLLHAGQPARALEHLPSSLSADPIQRRVEAVYWTEALLLLGERGAAQEWLARAVAAAEQSEQPEAIAFLDRLAARV